MTLLDMLGTSVCLTKWGYCVFPSDIVENLTSGKVASLQHRTMPAGIVVMSISLFVSGGRNSVYALNGQSLAALSACLPEALRKASKF